MVEIKWHGHAFFTITLSNGYTIAIDPHDGLSIGLKRPSVKADLILVTHDHFDHNAVEIARKNGTRIFKSFYGEANIDNILIKGYRTFHDKFGGRRRGENTIYKLSVEGINIAHLGDLGHIITGELVNELKDLDVLMIPIGGVYTIGPDEAWEIITTLNPKITIPMHYWIRGLTLPLHRIDDFLAYVKKIRVERLSSNTLSLDPESLPKEPIIAILTPP